VYSSLGALYRVVYKKVGTSMLCVKYAISIDLFVLIYGYSHYRDYTLPFIIVRYLSLLEF